MDGSRSSLVSEKDAECHSIYIYMKEEEKKSFLFFTYKRSLVVCEREGCWPYK